MATTLPVCAFEELLLRGFLLGPLVPFTSPLRAQASVAVLFALMHVPGWTALRGLQEWMPPSHSGSRWLRIAPGEGSIMWNRFDGVRAREKQQRISRPSTQDGSNEATASSLPSDFAILERYMSTLRELESLSTDGGTPQRSVASSTARHFRFRRQVALAQRSGAHITRGWAALAFAVQLGACTSSHSPAMQGPIGGSEGASLGPGVIGSGTPDGASGLETALCPSNAQLCDDFENGSLDDWNKLETGGTITLDSSHAFSGSAALSVQTPSNQRGGFIERAGAPLFPLPNGAFWGRLMVYFDSVPDGHSDLVRGAPAGGGVPWYNVGEQHGEILLNYYNNAPSDCWARPSPGKPVPSGTWMCWEWSFDNTTNEEVFWIDGQLSRRVSAVGDGCVTGGNQVWGAPEFGSLRLGEYIAQPSNVPTELWIDAVAVGTAGRLGCPGAP